ncbi:acetyl-CoA C-acyltransferase [Chloroflexota bacterium]
MMKETVIVNAVRTPIGNFGGSLRDIPAYNLAALVLNELVKKAKIKPEDVNMVIMGQNYQSGEYVNIARMSLLTAGWPVEIPGLTLDRRCPSGLDAICLASTLVQTGQVDIIVAGGVESMSTSELYLAGNIRWGVGGSGDSPRGHGSLSMWGLPLYDRVQRARVMSQPSERFGILPSMMSWAETAATEHKIPREEVDRWALTSNQRACAAMEAGKFKEEIVPVPLPQRKGDPVLFEKDERPRADTSLEALGKLRAVLGGVCTAGNSSGENDGSAVCLLMSPEKAAALKMKPMAAIKSFAFAGADPRFTWRSATNAVKLALEKAGLTIDQIDLIEIHEAFAVQALANFRELGIKEKDYDKVNVNGSCVSLGHPLGATGARITTTLIYEMQRRNARYGLIGICGGGGMGMGVVLEKA